MKITKEQKMIKLNIEYDLHKEERCDVFDYLDETYGKYNWRSIRSGPLGGNIGLVIAEVNIDEGGA